jgi:hypothetical protein
MSYYLSRPILRSFRITNIATISGEASVITANIASATFDKLQSDDGYDVFVLAGGSNMVGNGNALISELTLDYTNPMVLQLGAYANIASSNVDTIDLPARAQDPLDHPVGYARRWPAVANSSSIGLSFGKLHQTLTARTVMLVPVACPSSGFSTTSRSEEVITKKTVDTNWRTDQPNNLVTYAIERTNKAMAYHPIRNPGPLSGSLVADPANRLKAILWHQGEEDVGLDEQTYLSHMQNLVKTFRAGILGASDATPFIAGFLSPTLMQDNSGPAKVLRNMSDLRYFGVPNCHAVSTLSPSQLTTRDGHLFTNPALRELGRRYYVSYAQTDEKLWAVAGNAAVVGNVTVYPALPLNKYKSRTFEVRVRPVTSPGVPAGPWTSSYTFEYHRAYKPISFGGAIPEQSLWSNNHWTTVSLQSGSVVSRAEFEITHLSGPVASLELRPPLVPSGVNVSGNTVRLSLPVNSKVAVLVNPQTGIMPVVNDALFLFCDPPETAVPSVYAPETFRVQAGSTSLAAPLTVERVGRTARIIYFEPGIHYIGEKFTPVDLTGARANNEIQQIYLAGGALVIGSIHAPNISNLRINGRGIIAGQEAYTFKVGNADGGVSFSAIFLNKLGQNHIIEGITSILPLKFHLYVGKKSIVRNVKCFAYNWTTDGVDAGEDSLVEDCFFKLNDDNMKLYSDRQLWRNNFVWHQTNGAVIQFGWGDNSARGCRVVNTTVLNTILTKPAGAWCNHSIINWFNSTSRDTTHLDHVIDGINVSGGMPALPLWLFLAINLDASQGPSWLLGDGDTAYGTSGTTLDGWYEGMPHLGGYLGNLTIRNVSFGLSQLTNFVGADVDWIQSRGGVSTGNPNCFAQVALQNVKLGGECLNASTMRVSGVKAFVTPVFGCG